MWWTFSLEFDGSQITSLCELRAAAVIKALPNQDLNFYAETDESPDNIDAVLKTVSLRNSSDEEPANVLARRDRRRWHPAKTSE